MSRFSPPDFLVIPWAVAGCKDLQPLDLKVYGFVYWLEHLGSTKCIASNKYIAEAIQCTAVSVQNSLTRLERAGFITRTYDEKKLRKSIATTVRYVKVSSNDDRVSSFDDGGVSSNDDHKKKRLEEEKYKNILSLWNEQKIIVHSKLTKDAGNQLRIELKSYSVEEIEAMIKLYGKVLHGKEYYWSHKWNLYEFLKRGLKSFNGKTEADFKTAKKQPTFSQNQQVVKI
jgi:DNA-binding Lrp family transcriptional regulator